MKKILGLTVAFVIFGALLAGCGAPPPLKSDKYLKDTSLLSQDASCSGPCFHGIIVGKTNFSDALTTIKADPTFDNVQSQDKSGDKPAGASWAAKDGDPCCQLSATLEGVVSAMLVKVAPTMTAQQVIDKFGQPKFVNPVDYTDKEVAVAMVYPEKGLVAWVTPGDSTSQLAANSPVVMVLFLDPNDWDKIKDTATLQGWNGFLPYQTYKNATPVVTPRITPTAQ
ncbi:MAG: hypothetical protein ABI947_13870 [Chloroflexota bacterium]